MGTFAVGSHYQRTGKEKANRKDLVLDVVNCKASETELQ
jgi:hypothetical protein